VRRPFHPIDLQRWAIERFTGGLPDVDLVTPDRCAIRHHSRVHVA
jgi:hypothetical protein